MNLKYLKELDGLRGIAIMAMILGHFDPPIINIPAVNIFFVISGFIITKIVFSNYKNFSINEFYKKRFRSLYPTLVLVCLITFLITNFLGNIEHIRELNRSFITSILGVLNLYLIKIENIYTLQNYVNPYLPLWAFSIILQFYLIFPIIFKFILSTLNLFKIKIKNLFLIFLLLTLFFFSIYLANIQNIYGNFYFLGSRIWQFFLGSSLYFLLIFFPISIFSKISSWLSLVMFIFWPMILNITDNFILQTLYITFATSFLIYSINENNLVNQILGINIFRFLGKIAFSLFIIHMPVIYTLGIFFDKSILIILSLFISIILSIFLQKINKSQFFEILIFNFVSNKFYIKKTTILLFICLCLIYQLNKNLFLKTENIFINFNKIFNYTEKKRNYMKSKFGDFDYTPFRLINNKNQICHNNQDNFNNCYFRSDISSKNNKIDVISVGGSNIAALGYLAKEKFNQLGYNFQQITTDGCIYLPNFEKYNVYNNLASTNCNYDYQRKLSKFLKKKTNNDKIIMIYGRYALYSTSEFFDNEEGGLENHEKWSYSFRNKKNLSFLEGLKNSIENLGTQNIKVILIYPIPEVGVHLPKYLLKRFTKLTNELENNNTYTTSFEVFKKRNKEIFKVLDAVNNDNIFRVFPHKIFCDNEIENRCVTHDHKSLYYTDFDHLSHAGVTKVLNLILNEVEKIEFKK